MKLKNIRDVSRIEDFSDGVFAISATLLVVFLEVPQNFCHLVESLPEIIAFGFSLAALILIWSLYIKFFRRYDLRDGVTKYGTRTFVLFSRQTIQNQESGNEFADIID